MTTAPLKAPVQRPDHPAPPQDLSRRGLPDPDTPIMRFFYKMPIWAFRTGWQPIIGRLFVLMAHTGRKTGQTRYTPLEYRIAPNGRLYVISGYGDKSQWYKNIMADPYVTLQWAGHTEGMQAYRVTDRDELRMLFDQYLRERPVTTKAFLDMLEIPYDLDAIIAKADELYCVGFVPTNHPTPPPLKADLWWVNLVALGILLLLRRNR